jgi:hypothetical protein
LIFYISVQITNESWFVSHSVILAVVTRCAAASGQELTDIRLWSMIQTVMWLFVQIKELERI